MPRRPDPSTGLIPQDESMTYSAPVTADAQEMVERFHAAYPTLEAPSTMRSGRVRPAPEVAPRERIMAGAQLDMMRQQVALYISRRDDSGSVRALVPAWEAVEPGTASTVSPLYLTEYDARELYRSLEEITGRRDRVREWQQQYEEARAEVRSLANQLDEVRSHRDTLVEQATFLRRQVAWLERELRDAHRERRGTPAAPEAPPSAFAG